LVSDTFPAPSIGNSWLLRTLWSWNGGNQGSVHYLGSTSDLFQDIACKTAAVAQHGLKIL